MSLLQYRPIAKGSDRLEDPPKFGQVHSLRSTFLSVSEFFYFVTRLIYHIWHFILSDIFVDNFRALTLKLLSRNPTFYLQNEQFGNLILRQIIKFAANICQILRLKCTKFKFGQSSAPYPAGEA